MSKEVDPIRSRWTGGVQFHILSGVGRAWHRERGGLCALCWHGVLEPDGGRRPFHEVGAKGRSGLMWSAGNWWGEKAFSARDGK